MAKKLTGKITGVNSSGNLVTDISADQLVDCPKDEQLKTSCDGHFTYGIFPANHNEPAMTLLAMIGDSGFLEISMVGEDASVFLGIETGAEVVLEW